MPIAGSASATTATTPTPGCGAAGCSRPASATSASTRWRTGRCLTTRRPTIPSPGCSRTCWSRSSWPNPCPSPTRAGRPRFRGPPGGARAARSILVLRVRRDPPPLAEDRGPLLELLPRERRGLLGGLGRGRTERAGEEQVGDRDLGPHRARVAGDLEVRSHPRDVLLAVDPIFDDGPDDVIGCLRRPGESHLDAHLALGRHHALGAVEDDDEMRVARAERPGEQ